MHTKGTENNSQDIKHSFCLALVINCMLAAGESLYQHIVLPVILVPTKLESVSDCLECSFKLHFCSQVHSNVQNMQFCLSKTKQESYETEGRQENFGKRSWWGKQAGKGHIKEDATGTEISHLRSNFRSHSSGYYPITWSGQYFSQDQDEKSPIFGSRWQP